MRKKRRPTKVSFVSAPNRTAALILTVFALTCLGIGLTVLSAFFASPAQGVIYAVNAALFSQNNLDMTPSVFVDDYATFSYPKGLTTVAPSKFGPPVVAVYNLTYRDIQTWRLAVSIVRVPSDSLYDNNAYQFRKINPSKYAESQLRINGQNVRIMTDTSASGFSQVAFLVHGQYQAIISLYGDDPRGTSGLESTFTMILSSWHWLQS